MSAGSEKHRDALIRTFGLRDDIMRAAQGFMAAKHRRRGVRQAEMTLLRAVAAYNLRKESV